MARKTVKRSSAPAFPEHPPAEHKWRIDRARKIMREQKLDALVLSRNVNVFYATGSRFVFVGFDAPLALAPQSSAIITQDADIYCQRFGSFDTDDVGIHTALSESLEHYDDDAEIVSILKDYGIGKGHRVGIEWGSGQCTGINPIKFQSILAAAETSGFEFVDGTPAVWKITAIKSKLEIERMRVAVRAAALAMNRICDYIELGMTEVDVARKVSQFMLEEGGDKVSHSQVTSDTGPYKFIGIDALDRKLETGWVHLDVGCRYRRYGSDINRGLFLGRKPTRDEEKLYACRKGANDVMEKTIKPGVCMDDVIAAVKTYAEKCGCELKEFAGAAFLGHGIGLEFYQQPSIVPSAMQPVFQNAQGKVLFEPGMMFTFEMPIELPGVTLPFFNIEDDVVVSETGVENMSVAVSREMRVKTGGRGASVV